MKTNNKYSELLKIKLEPSGKSRGKMFRPGHVIPLKTTYNRKRAQKPLLREE